MPNDHELKAKVTEKTHDDFLLLARQMGFDNRSEYLRYLVERELYGATSMVNFHRFPGAITGQNAGHS